MIILGSQSPRRKEILEYFSLPFTIQTSDFDEESVPFKGHAGQYVMDISRGKAALLAKKFPDEIILTADTTVHKDGKVYNKPSSDKDAVAGLMELVGQWHGVFTGVTLQKGDQVWSSFEETKVLFNNLTQPQVEHYIASTHWSDKAGGYALQMAGGLIVERIEGCYYNVIGLPINTVRKLLKHVDIDLWDYIK
jgi:septum formation protein